MSLARRTLSRLDLLIHSIRFRLALWFVFILAIVLVVFSALLFLAQIRELRAETVNRLESKLEQVEHSIGLTPAGGLTLADPHLVNVLGSEGTILQSNDVFALLNPDGTLVYISGPLSSAPILDLSHVELDPREHAIEYRTLLHARDVDFYAFLITPLVAPSRVLTGFMVIGTPLDPRGQLKQLALTLVILTGLMLLLAFAGGFWLAARAMSPVRTIADRARAIGETDLSQRFNLGRKDEIGLLADTFDSMLTRLDAAFSRQRQFTADASHELRTPLTIVSLEASRALAAPRRPAEYQRALEIIRSENELMSRLVNDLLTLARLDAGREVLRKDALDLSGIALEALERFETLAARQGVQVKAGDLPEVPVMGDHAALLRLVSNLVENAIKYTASSASAERRVLVETGALPEQSIAWIRVTDTGPGIPSQELPHIFDRFYRADKSRARSQDEGPIEDPLPSSSGLGLAIVDGLARLHNGTVEAHSDLGHGSTFELKLPLLTK